MAHEEVTPIPPPQSSESVSYGMYGKIGTAVGSALLPILIGIAGSLYGAGLLDKPAADRDVKALKVQMTTALTDLDEVKKTSLETKQQGADTRHEVDRMTRILIDKLDGMATAKSAHKSRKVANHSARKPFLGL